MILIRLILLSLALSFPFCSALYSQSGSTYSLRDNVLVPNLSSCDTALDVEGFYDFGGLKISKYYVFLDTVDLYLNNDTVMDKLFVLSPSSQEIPMNESFCSEMGKRLFVAIVSDKDKFEFFIVNENLILNRFDYQNEPYCGMKFNSGKLEFCFYTGSVMKCEYKIAFDLIDGDFCLARRTSDCYLIDLSRSSHYTVDFNPVDSNAEDKIFLQNIDIDHFLDVPELYSE